LASIEEDEVPTELLRASEAARRLDVPTKELLRLVQERKIRFEMIDGIAHIPVDAVEEYRAKAS
jgi:excisionase family DNA binding protein